MYATGICSMMARVKHRRRTIGIDIDARADQLRQQLRAATDSPRGESPRATSSSTPAEQQPIGHVLLELLVSCGCFRFMYCPDSLDECPYICQDTQGKLHLRLNGYKSEGLGDGSLVPEPESEDSHSLENGTSFFSLHLFTI